MRFFRDRAFSAANGASLFMYFGMFGSIFLLSQFLQTAQGYSPLEAGPAHPAVDGDADVRRADRRRALRSHRRRAAHGDRPRAAGDRPRPGSRRCPTPTVGYASLVGPFIVSGIGMGAVLRAGRQRRPVAPCAGRGGQGVRARTTRSARSAACSASPCWRRSSPATAATSRPRPSPTALVGRRRGSAPPSSRAGCGARDPRSRLEAQPCGRGRRSASSSRRPAERWSDDRRDRLADESRWYRRRVRCAARTRCMTRRTRQVGTLVLTAAAIAYLVWKIELGTTLDVLADTNLAWFALAVAIMVVTVPVLALRWGWLLAAHDIHERVPWLTRAYFVAYTAGQVLPDRRSAATPCASSRRCAGIPGGRRSSRGRSCSSAGSAARRPCCSARSAFLLSIGELRRQRVPLARGRLRLRDARARISLLRALGAAAAAPGRAAARAAAARDGRCGPSTRASTTTAAVPGSSGRSSA